MSPLLSRRQLLLWIKMFTLNSLGSTSFFLGFEATIDAVRMSLTHKKYLRYLLAKTNMVEANLSPTPMCPSHRLKKDDNEAFDHQVSLYWKTIGSLQYLTMTLPDIIFVVNRLSQYLQSPTIKHWVACKRLLIHFASTLHYDLRFTPANPRQLTGYGDADRLSSLDDRRSTSGFCVFLGNTLITW